MKKFKCLERKLLFNRDLFPINVLLALSIQNMDFAKGYPGVVIVRIPILSIP